MAVQNSNHFGIAGFYSRMALNHDLTGIALTNSTRDEVCPFGREVMLGTNPISVAVPAGGENPYVLDMSTAVITSGKLESRSRMGKKIPPGWAVGEKGEPCDDPARVYANMRGKRGGGLLPLRGAGEEFGGHKGYGLGLLVDIFSGVLSASANTTLLYPKDSEGKPLPSRVGHFLGGRTQPGPVGDRGRNPVKRSFCETNPMPVRTAGPLQGVGATRQYRRALA